MLTVKAKPWCPLSFSMSTVSWLPLELMSHVTTFAPISAYLVNINKSHNNPVDQVRSCDSQTDHFDHHRKDRVTDDQKVDTNLRHISLPIPDPPPVTRTIWPLISCDKVCLLAYNVVINCLLAHLVKHLGGDEELDGGLEDVVEGPSGGRGQLQEHAHSQRHCGYGPEI